MLKAILYKEWLKTRWYILVINLMGIALLCYLFLKLGRSYRLVGKVHLWDVIINRYQPLFTQLKYFPLAISLIFGMAQYIPEMSKKRLKLTLHLPLSQRKSLFIMLGYGLGVVFLSLVIQILILLFYSNIYFPAEITQSILITLLPYYLASFSAYIFATFICLEPTWKRRFLYLLLMLPVLQLFFMSDFPSAYSNVIWLVLLIPFSLVSFPMLSIYRFKQGKQD